MRWDESELTPNPVSLTPALPQFLDVSRQQLAQTRESGVLREIDARIAQRPRDVLDIHGIATCGGLITERAERLEIPLQRHQVEAAAELVGGTIGLASAEG